MEVEHALWRQSVEFKSQLLCLLVAWSWVNHFISLCTDSFVHRVGILGGSSEVHGADLSSVCRRVWHLVNL